MISGSKVGKGVDEAVGVRESDGLGEGERVGRLPGASRVSAAERATDLESGRRLGMKTARAAIAKSPASTHSTRSKGDRLAIHSLICPPTPRAA